MFENPYITKSALESPVGLILAEHNGRTNAMTVSCFSEVAHHPTTLWVSIARGSLTHELVSSPREHGPDITINCESATLQLWPGENFYDVWPVAPGTLSSLLSYVRPAWLSERLQSPNLRRKRKSIPEEDRQGYISEIQEFLSAIEEQREPVTKPEDGRRDLEIILRAYEALKKEKWESL